MASEVNGLDTASLLLGRAGEGLGNLGRGADEAAGSNEGALLGSRLARQLASHRAKRLGETAGGHSELWCFGGRGEWRGYPYKSFVRKKKKKKRRRDWN